MAIGHNMQEPMAEADQDLDLVLDQPQDQDQDQTTSEDKALREAALHARELLGARPVGGNA